MSRKLIQPTISEKDGWLSPTSSKSDFDSSSEDESTLDIAAYNQQLANSILVSKNHSLEPDMMFGWRPKLPSCPLPLTYPNAYVDSLLKQLSKDNRFSIAYVGPKYVNSVQVNQQFQYTWKYRDRYSLNLALVKEAVEKVGREQNHLNFDSLNKTANVNNVNSIRMSQVEQLPFEYLKNRSNKSLVGLKGENEKGQFTFDSQFESGNLQLAVRVKTNQYDCFIRSDTNTRGHTNWFYFRVSNGEQLGQLRINICNITKTRNLYSKGMKPYVLQRGEASKDNTEGLWSQNPCYDVLFVERYCRYGFQHKNFQLQFKYNFKEKNKHVYFAYAVPYSYSKLESFINQISQAHPRTLKCKKLCESLGGLEVPLLSITNPENEGQNSDQNNSKGNTNHTNSGDIQKKAILLTARIHPGQSNASHVIEGFIRQILKETPQASYLRNIFHFYVVPMINPDGVVAGNFRTSYSGKDLNRQFKHPNKYIFPQVSALHDLAIQLRNSYPRGVEFYMDFHGHSVKKGLFCYGPEHPPSKGYFFKSRALAKLIEQMHPIFSYKKSIFTISQHKKTTGRAHMLWKVKIPMTFTFEISNGMYEDNNKNDVYLDRQILLEAGRTVYRGFFRYIQLEMRMPKNALTNKNGQSATSSSKQINVKRTIQSSKSIRTSKHKTYQNANRTSKLIPITGSKQKCEGGEVIIQRRKKSINNRKSGVLGQSSSGNLNKTTKNKSRAKIRYAKQDNQQTLIPLNQGGIFIEDSIPSDRGYLDNGPKNLLSLFREIKEQNRKAENDNFMADENPDFEGGSDSEGSEQDLTNQESNNLFKQIVSRNDTKNGYKNHNWRTKNVKLNLRKKVSNLKVVEQQKEEDKKKANNQSSRLDELSKPYSYSNGVMRLVRRGTNIQYDKVVVAQKNFTLNI